MYEWLVDFSEECNAHHSTLILLFPRFSVSNETLVWGCGGGGGGGGEGEG